MAGEKDWAARAGSPAGKPVRKITDIVQPFLDSLHINRGRPRDDLDKAVVDAVYMRAAALTFATHPAFDAYAELPVLSHSNMVLGEALMARNNDANASRRQLDEVNELIKSGLGIDKSIV